MLIILKNIFENLETGFWKNNKEVIYLGKEKEIEKLKKELEKRKEELEKMESECEKKINEKKLEVVGLAYDLNRLKED